MTMTTMSPAQARAARLPTLNAQVARGAICADTDTADWVRGDREDPAAWRMRISRLRAICDHCPVLVQCREVALRLDAEPHRADADMVRAGMTTIELVEMARRQRASLRDAIARDQGVTERQAVGEDQAAGGRYEWVA